METAESKFGNTIYAGSGGGGNTSGGGTVVEDKVHIFGVHWKLSLPKKKTLNNIKCN